MPVHTDLNKLPLFHHAVITVGTFDGIHNGHKILIRQIINEAKKRDGASILISFDPHPKSVIMPQGEQLRLLTTNDEKTALIEKEGVDHMVIAPFTKEFSKLSAMEYIEQFLVKRFHPAAIVLGYNHRFGHHRDGNIELLGKLSGQYQFDVIEIHKQLINDIEVSSTRIRLALTEGDVSTANSLLGRRYSFQGIVIKGDQRGRTIGFPTANLKLNNEQKLIPARGVYAIYAGSGNKVYKGMMNIGVRPTVNGTTETIEAHLFDFNQDIYGERLTIDCVCRIRNEIKFESIDRLKHQLELDKQSALLHL
jgi:riboflavin kinase/FMN adenylyltransferase